MWLTKMWVLFYVVCSGADPSTCTSHALSGFASMTTCEASVPGVIEALQAHILSAAMEKEAARAKMEVDFCLPRSYEIHPVAEAKAYADAVRSGMPRSEVAAQYGCDVDQIDEENAADLERTRKLGVAGVDVPAGEDGQPCISTHFRILDLDETRANFARLEAERDEAVARADVADYTRDAIVQRCLNLEKEALSLLEHPGIKAAFEAMR